MGIDWFLLSITKNALFGYIASRVFCGCGFSLILAYVQVSEKNLPAGDVPAAASRPPLSRNRSEDSEPRKGLAAGASSPLRERLLRLRRSITEPLLQYFHDIHMVRSVFIPAKAVDSATAYYLISGAITLLRQ